ncbi:hypothetical protein [Polluticoccus soli]|uniref:hypothetical protein n=1 Tax=Polluticoccus soli TaxID=3034150 RepID=UPI0023E09E3C|nr:hypothetical protein [Flavipsychrobacter sp. JY13-12]
MYEKKKLYRKANKTAHNYYHNIPPGDFADERHTKVMKNFEGSFQSMHGKKERGYDYTPLFKFLLSKVGQKWDEVYSEAVSRLDKKDPVFWMVTMHPKENEWPTICIDESSFYSKLTVNEEGILVKYAPEFTMKDLQGPTCNCCTYTFNGELWKDPTGE